MMDLDGFKRVNDLLRHHAGDEALRRVAFALRSTSRAEDGSFRWGGDEFDLLLAGGSKAEARAADDLMDERKRRDAPLPADETERQSRSGSAGEDDDSDAS